MNVRLWEWGVVQEARANPVGVCMTRDGAMAALAGALEAAGRPGRGHVRPVGLAGSVYMEPEYVRFPIDRTAVYEHGVVRWECPSRGERWQHGPGVTGKGRNALCGV